MIARGWPASKILVKDVSFKTSSTAADIIKYNTCIEDITERRNTLFLPTYGTSVAKGGALLLIDAVHPSDYGISAVYVNPIIAKLGDSVRVEGQQMQVNGLAEFQRLKLRIKDTLAARSYAIPIGMDSVGNVVMFDRNRLIENSDISYPYKQAASIDISGTISVGQAAIVGGNAILKVSGNMQAKTGQFTEFVAPTTGAGLELGGYLSGGYLQGFNRGSSVATNITVQPFGGNMFFGALSGTGSNKWQFTGTGHFTTGLYLGGTTTATSALHTTSFATAYTATATSLGLSGAHHTVNITATGQTITLPTAVGITGRQYTIKLTASGTGTVATTSSQTIDGVTTYTLSAQYKYVTITSDGANWIITGNN